MVKNRKLLHRIMISRFWLSFFVIIVVLLVFNSVSLFFKREKVWKKVDQLENEKKILVDQQNYISAKNEGFDEGIGKEAILRDKFNVIKPGEKVIIFTEPKVDQDIPVVVPSVWDKIKHFLHLDK